MRTDKKTSEPEIQKQKIKYIFQSKIDGEIRKREPAGLCQEDRLIPGYPILVRRTAKKGISIKGAWERPASPSERESLLLVINFHRKEDNCQLRYTNRVSR